MQPFMRFRRWIIWLAILLLAKVFADILWEYRWYFPTPQFAQSDFLIGHESEFPGNYATAFYLHIVCGPIALLTGTVLLATSRARKLHPAHRIAGRLQLVTVMAGVVPSGLVMAQSAVAGPIATAGFSIQAIATAACLLTSVYHAMHKNLQAHRQWALRCCILLAAPLLLRVLAGFAMVAGLESIWFDQINAWASWIAPWFIYEYARHIKSTAKRSCNTHLSLTTETA